jgi:pre-rRNA-processing protein TSR3
MSSDSEGSVDESPPVITCSSKKRVRQIVLFEYKQNDPKRDTGMKLARQGLVRSMRPGDPFKGIVLSAYGRSILSMKDASLVACSGIAAINCSWNRLDEITNVPGGNISRHRKLPFLVAANPINYGKAYKLSSAEALAAALAMVGFQEEAERLTEKFSWSDEFWKLNGELIDEYNQCTNSAEVEAIEKKYVAEKSADREEISYEDILAGLDDEQKRVSFTEPIEQVREFAKYEPIKTPIIPPAPISSPQLVEEKKYPIHAPQDQKKCLLILKQLPLGESLGIGKHVSGNALAKMKRKEYFAIWERFIAADVSCSFYDSLSEVL